MTEKRPSLQRKHTRSTEAARESELDQGISITIDGRAYVVRIGDLTALDAREFRRQVGMSFIQTMEALNDSADLDLVAAIVWMARRLEGERPLTYDAVASSLTYADMENFEVGDSAAEEVETGPEA